MDESSNRVIIFGNAVDFDTMAVRIVSHSSKPDTKETRYKSSLTIKRESRVIFASKMGISVFGPLRRF